MVAIVPAAKDEQAFRPSELKMHLINKPYPVYKVKVPAFFGIFFCRIKSIFFTYEPDFHHTIPSHQQDVRS